VNQAVVRYCENCGQPLNAQAHFCGRCGKAVPQQVPASAPTRPRAPAPRPLSRPAPHPAAALQPGAATSQPVAAPQSAEIIVAVLPVGTRRSGFLGLRAEGFVLVLTNMRILAAQQTSQIMKENARQAKQAAKESGKGFFGQWGAVIGSYSSQRYMQMLPQDILSETPGNYSILNNQVHSVRIEEDFDSEEGTTEVKLTLDTGSGKTELTYTQSSKKEIKRALQQTLGGLVR